MPLAIGVATAAMAAPQGAAGDDRARAVGDWTVAPSADGKGCFVTRVYADHPGRTTLLLGIDTDGANHLSVLNGNWSIRPKDRLKLDFRLTAGSYAKHFAVGIAADGQQGFVTSFEAKFPTYFASSTQLAIARGSVPVERLALAGSGAAVAALRRCVEARRHAASAKAKAAQATGPGAIPRDPFAPAPARKGKR